MGFEKQTEAAANTVKTYIYDCSGATNVYILAQSGIGVTNTYIHDCSRASRRSA